MTCLLLRAGWLATLTAVRLPGAGVTPESLATRLPRFEARTLDGRLLVLPDSAAGRTTMVGFTYRRELGEELSKWLTEFARKFPDSVGFLGYEIPMMGRRIPGVLRGVISSGMKRAIPPERHRWYAPFYGDAEQYAAAFGMNDRSTVHVALLDREGLVRWRFNGKPTEAAFAGLESAVAKIRR